MPLQRRHRSGSERRRWPKSCQQGPRSQRGSSPHLVKLFFASFSEPATIRVPTGGQQRRRNRIDGHLIRQHFPGPRHAGHSSGNSAERSADGASACGDGRRVKLERTPCQSHACLRKSVLGSRGIDSPAADSEGLFHSRSVGNFRLGANCFERRPSASQAGGVQRRWTGLRYCSGPPRPATGPIRIAATTSAPACDESITGATLSPLQATRRCNPWLLARLRLPVSQLRPGLDSVKPLLGDAKACRASASTCSTPSASRVKQQYLCSEGRTRSSNGPDMVKGYEFEKDRYVMLQAG